MILDDHGIMEVIGFSLKDCLSSLSCIRLMIPQKLTGTDEKRKCREQLKEIQKRYPDGLPLMDPIEDMHIIGMQNFQLNTFFTRKKIIYVGTVSWGLDFLKRYPISTIFRI
jgi:hypothetical protein